MFFVPTQYAALGTNLKVVLPTKYSKEPVDAEVVSTPFKKPESSGSGLSKTGRKLET